MAEDTLSKEEVIKALESKAEFLLGEVSRTKNSLDDLLVSVEGDVVVAAINLIRSLQFDYSSSSKASEEWKAKYEAERKENVELQNQVDEYKAKLPDDCIVLYKEDAEAYRIWEEKYGRPRYIDGCMTAYARRLQTAEHLVQQAAKDKAKEVWNKAYRIACNTRGEITEQSIKEIAKREYDVEVGE